MRHVLLPRLRDLLFMAIFSGALLIGSRMLNTDGDLGRHLTLGNYMLSMRQVPTLDLLTFSKPDQPRPPYEWLAELLFALAYRILNLDGVVLLTAFIIAATFVLVYIDSLHRSKAPILALIIVTWAALAASVHWLTRPHVFTFLFLAIWIRRLERIQTREDTRLWQFPLLMLVWANMHGGFVFGFLAWLAYLGGWVWKFFTKSADLVIGRNLLISGATSLAASVLTPDSWHNWAAVLNNRSAYILQHTVETMPPDLSTPEVWPFLALGALTLFFGLLDRRRVEPRHALLLAGFGAMSLAMARNIPLFVIAAAPILATWMIATLGKVELWTRLEAGIEKIDADLHGFLWSAATVLAALGVFGYHAARSATPFFQFSPQVFPVQAATWVETHPMRGEMFNDFNWGGYLLFRLWPKYRVFVDSQSDFYGEDFMRQYEQIYVGGKDWDAKLRESNVDWVIVPREAGLAAAAGASPGWQIVYEDSLTVIFARK